MPRPRKSLVNKSTTLYYHCMSRCVRRAYLCGRDDHSGQSYEHRRQWIVERIHFLASVFAIDICAYAIMHNHYHIVLRLGSSQQWSDESVISRWLLLFQGSLLARRFQAGEALTSAELQTVSDIAKVWRLRLQDLSWFMKCLNEPIARAANQEDHCSGHFWEARFKSQALPSDEALMACMAYVDLNPVRAGIAKSPDSSDHTSLQLRLKPPVNRLLQKALSNMLPNTHEVKPLASFSTGKKLDDAHTLPFTLKDYLQLVDWTSRQCHPRKKGVISKELPPILARLEIDPQNWLTSAQHFEQIYQQLFRSTA